MKKRISLSSTVGRSGRENKSQSNYAKQQVSTRINYSQVIFHKHTNCYSRIRVATEALTKTPKNSSE